MQELTLFFLFILPLATNALETDRVFGADTPTKQVYEEGARAVALSAVGGINCEYFSWPHLLPDILIHLQTIDDDVYVQQAFSHMGKPAVERRTPWPELQNVQ